MFNRVANVYVLQVKTVCYSRHWFVVVPLYAIDGLGRLMIN